MRETEIACRLEGCETMTVYDHGYCGPHFRTVYRFWQNLEIGDPDECWEWKGSRTPKGYGKIDLRVGNTTMQLASRIVFLLLHHVNPGLLYVCHTCDNPPCCNPNHLFLGTAADNTADARMKGRLKGNRAGTPVRKISDDDVREIRKLINQKVTYKQIALQFHVSPACICAINVGRIRASVT